MGRTMTTPTPPTAKKVPKAITLHGDSRKDYYYWMRFKDDPDVIGYVEEENSYTDEMMKHTVPLQDALLREFESRMADEDLTVPEAYDGYLYYRRTDKGRQYPVYLRRREGTDSEEVVLDQNAASEGHEYFEVKLVRPSPDHRMVAYTADVDGSERYRVFVRDIASGDVVDASLDNADDVVWGEGSDVLYYSIINESHRRHKVLRHRVGADRTDDLLVYHEKDPAFEYLRVSKTKTGKYVMITSQSLTKSEVQLLRANGSEELWTLKPREDGVKYYAVHADGRFFIVTNEDAPNMRLMTVEDSDPRPENWREVLPNRDSVAICVSDPEPWVEPFENHLAVYELENGAFRINVIDLRSGSARIVPLPVRHGTVRPEFGHDLASTVLRFTCSSPLVPRSTYDYHMDTDEMELRRRETVPAYDPEGYEMHRTVARSADGASIPMFVVHRKGLGKDGGRPLYLYAYGAYGDFESVPTSFDSTLVSLLDRGFVCAFVQIRGGGEMGGEWYRAGVMMTKKNSFEDFIAAAEHMIREGYTSKDRIVVRGGSAGGLLVAAAMVMRPDLFGAVVAEVPFVDVVTTQMDPKIPLVPGEYEEWGNPDIPEQYRYMKSYSPYDRIERRGYPSTLLTTGMNDPRVPYWEPLKMAARMRELKTDDNVLLLSAKLTEGHHGGSGRYDSLRDTAFVYAFMLDALGITGPNRTQE